MIRRELAKDPKLASESWDRFLPQFRKRHLTTAQKTAKKNAKQAISSVSKDIAVTPHSAESSGATVGKSRSKKPYTPFPPAQIPRKVDLQLESGEYFLKLREKEIKTSEKRKQRVSVTQILVI